MRSDIKRNAQILSIDWLEICGKGEPQIPAPWQVVQESYGTKIFKNRYTVYLEGKEFAIICTKPRSEILASDMVTVKLSNWVLYNYDAIKTMRDFCKTIRVEINNITRLDIACDFNEMAQGITGKALIQKFIKSDYVLNRRGKYAVQGNTANPTDFQYLKIGSGSSDVFAVLYNKTLELKESKDKAYIRERWEKEGIDTTRDVWRLEIRIRNSRIELIGEDKKAVKFTIDALAEEGEIMRAFWALTGKYFTWKEKNTKVKKKQNWKKVILFASAWLKVAKKDVISKIQNTRTTKMVVKFLEKEVRDLRATADTAGELAEKFLNNLVLRHKMEDFYFNKIYGQDFPLTHAGRLRSPLPTMAKL